MEHYSQLLYNHISLFYLHLKYCAKKKKKKIHSWYLALIHVIKIRSVADTSIPRLRIQVIFSLVCIDMSHSSFAGFEVWWSCVGRVYVQKKKIVIEVQAWDGFIGVELRLVKLSLGQSWPKYSIMSSSKSTQMRQR